MHMSKSKTILQDTGRHETSNYWIVKGNINNPDRDGDIVKQMRGFIPNPHGQQAQEAY